MTKAFIAANNYIQKSVLPFGVGVIAAFDEECAKKDSRRLQHLYTQNIWYSIELPELSNFLKLDSTLTENTEATQFLFSVEAMRLLFIDEARTFFRSLDAYVNSKNIEKKEAYVHEELARFYKEKADFLKSHKSVSDIVRFITGKAKNHNPAITSGFLFQFGIPGIIYAENNEQRVLVFDAKHSIRILHVHSEQTANSLFA